MTDIILEARKQAVLSGLQRVRREVVALDRQRQELTDLRKILSAEVQDLASQIEIDLTTPIVWARNPDTLLVDAVRLELFTTSIEAAAKKAKSLAELAKLANVRAAHVEQSWQLPRTVKGAVNQLFDQAKSSKNDLAACTDWASFQTVLRETVRPLFDEHLDLLEGAAFRVVGYDDGLARDADDVLDRLEHLSTVDSYLAVPSRGHAVREVVARLVRMGFPGWSFWDLPLLAYEFGHIVALTGNVARELRDAQPRTLQWRETILADAFATYTLGPAYAIAAIMLALDPTDVATDDGPPSGRQRAELILDQLRSRSGVEKYFERIANQLAALWYDIALPPEDHELVEARTWAANAQQLLRDDLEVDNATAYPEDQWRKVSDWPGRLLDDDAEDHPVLRDEDILDLLNVAWVCRINNPDQAPAILDAIDRLREPTPAGRRRAAGSSPERGGSTGET